jgi:fatty acid desaturase
MGSIEATGPRLVPPPRRRSDYAELMRRVRSAGLLDRRLAYYTWRVVLDVLLLVAGWTVFALVGDSWWQLVTAAYLAVVFTQLGFLGHEAGHGQVSRSRRTNRVLGLLLGNLAIGLAFGWWVEKHHRHHAHPNTEGLDPDIRGGAVAFTVGQARDRGAARGLLARHQAELFFPMLLLEAGALHVASLRALSHACYRDRGREALLLAVHVVAYLTVVVVVLSPVRAVVFVLVQQALFGLYLGASFAPNHKGMAILGPDDGVDFLRRQVLTSRNVSGGPLVDVLLGGLNYQIEHHLFPSMPRPALRRARPIVQGCCRELAIPYVETSISASYRQALRYLHAVGRAAVAPPG